MLRTVGERAAQVIMAQATIKGIPIEKELETIGANRKIYRDWKKCGRNPQAYYLTQMALAGYDMMWILTGIESK